LIEDIYAAAVGDADPVGLLDRIGSLAGFDVCGMVTTRSSTTGSKCNAAWGIDSAACDRAEREFSATATVLEMLGRPLSVGEFGFRDEFISAAQLRRQSFYRDFVAPNGLEEGAIICLENSDSRATYLNLARPVRSADHAEQTRILRILSPHLARAMRVARKLQQAAAQRETFTEAAEAAPFALTVIDNHGAIYLANQHAESLRREDGLSIQDGTLRATLDAENIRLQQAIRTIVAASTRGGVPGAGCDLSIQRPAQSRPYQLLITPLHPEHQREGRRPAATVFIFDPDAELTVPFERCREVFGFTRAEAEIAIGVMQGRAIEEIASTHGKTVTTARNLLKRVFVKAGVSRQSELTRLMLRSPLHLARTVSLESAKRHEHAG
jgi:DNA-binding CsgD family transcriptional regulator